MFDSLSPSSVLSALLAYCVPYMAFQQLVRWKQQGREAGCPWSDSAMQCSCLAVQL